MDIKKSINDVMFERAHKHITGLPESLLQEELRNLESRIAEAKRSAERTIRPVRLLLSVHSFLLLEGGRRLYHPPVRDGRRPQYGGMICHPSVFPDTDVNPFQFLILG